MIYENCSLLSACYQVNLAVLGGSITKCIGAESSFIKTAPHRGVVAFCEGLNCIYTLASNSPLPFTLNNVRITLCSGKHSGLPAGGGDPAVTWLAENRSRRDRTGDMAGCPRDGHGPGSRKCQGKNNSNENPPEGIKTFSLLRRNLLAKPVFCLISKAGRKG